MNIREELSQVLREYGRYVLLVRYDKRQRCKCWNHVYQSPDASCPICFGNGFVFVAEKLLTREIGKNVPETLSRAIKSTDLGYLYIPSKMFYFEYDVRPNVRDLVIECEWNEFNRPVFDEYSQVNEINHVDPYRGTKGRIEYFRVACKHDPVKINRMKAYITSHGDSAVYGLALDGDN